MNFYFTQITGGSSGIGLSLAAEVLKSGGNVTIIARNPKKLKDAEEHLKNINEKVPFEARGKIQSFECKI